MGGFVFNSSPSSKGPRAAGASLRVWPTTTRSDDGEWPSCVLVQPRQQNSFFVIAPPPPPLELLMGGGSSMGSGGIALNPTTNFTKAPPAWLGGRGNSTKIPSPRMDPAERPTDPGRRN